MKIVSLFGVFGLLAASTANLLAGEIKDPNGYYKAFSDSSITKPPPKDMKIGNGQLVSISYDGSKGGPSLFYQLSYVDPKGDVRPITGGPFDSKGDGLFTRDIKVFTSDANGRPGFMEVTTVSGGAPGKIVKLGTYPVVFEISSH